MIEVTIVRHSPTSAHNDRLMPTQAADNLSVTLITSKAHSSLRRHVNMFNCTMILVCGCNRNILNSCRLGKKETELFCAEEGFFFVE